ncbi:MAG: hypothetical protein HYZ26_14455 [Chloroflexi bacterium]|nr:hypothetical protein [Chloroflexota bacterium]
MRLGDFTERLQVREKPGQESIYIGKLARFSQPDTIVSNPFNPQLLNRFTYTLNNPIRFTDPSGHIVCDEFGFCWDGSRQVKGQMRTHELGKGSYTAPPASPSGDEQVDDEVEDDDCETLKCQLEDLVDLDTAADIAEFLDFANDYLKIYDDVGISKYRLGFLIDMFIQLIRDRNLPMSLVERILRAVFVGFEAEIIEDLSRSVGLGGGIASALVCSSTGAGLGVAGDCFIVGATLGYAEGNALMTVASDSFNQTILFPAIATYADLLLVVGEIREQRKPHYNLESNKMMGNGP